MGTRESLAARARAEAEEAALVEKHRRWERAAVEEAALVEKRRAREREEHFYSAYAEFVGALEGCSRCIALGGAWLGLGTPDIIGVVPGDAGAPAPYGPLVVAGELKRCSYAALNGFGQAYGYRLFAHKSYLAVPRDADGARLALLTALCGMARLGLAVFDADRPREPHFELVLPAFATTPDMRELNARLRKLPELDAA